MLKAWRIAAISRGGRLISPAMAVSPSHSASWCVIRSATAARRVWKSGVAAMSAMNTAPPVSTRDDGYVQDRSSQWVAAAVGAAVGIDDVIADVLPDGKVDVIQQLRDRGRMVAMVGDGINDGPALACSDLGLAIGRGTDVAIGAADIILVRDSLDSVPQALDLAKATMRTIQMNLVWAFGYNIAAIPVAAAGLLNPLIAGGAMAFSSFFVVSNSLRLRNFK